METNDMLISELNSMRILLQELLQSSRIKTNASITKEYDTSKTTEVTVDGHELLGGTSDNLILSMTVIDVGGGIKVRLNNDDKAITMSDGDYTENEIIHKVGIIGTGAGTAVIRYGIHIPEYVRN